MSKKEDLLKLIYPHIPPYEQVGHYFLSQQSTNNIKLPGYDFNKARAGPESDLITARRSFEKVIKELNAKKHWQKQRRIVLDKEWDELEELELKFKDQFKELNTFIIGNDEKRNRAIKRHAEDVKLIKHRSEEIEKKKREIAIIEAAKKEFDEDIDSHKIYEIYLNSVLGVSNEFKNADNILDRYESLIKTKIELGERQNRNFELLEESRGKLNRMADECSFKILGMNNILTNLQSRYLSAFNASMHWERIVYGIKSFAYQKYKEITEVKQGCLNTYLLMVKRKGEVAKISDDDFEEQLIYIKRTLKQLETVTREANKRNKATFSSMKGEMSKVS